MFTYNFQGKVLCKLEILWLRPRLNEDLAGVGGSLGFQSPRREEATAQAELIRKSMYPGLTDNANHLLELKCPSCAGIIRACQGETRS